MKERTPLDNPAMKAVYLMAVETQLRDNKPPETRQTFDRLIAAGIGKDDAKELIASVIAVESLAILKTGAPFDRKRFVRNLARLPELPTEAP